MMKDIAITTPFIKLDGFLKFSGVVMSGGEAKGLISDGQVSVCGDVCLVLRKKLYPGDSVQVKGENFRVISKE